MSEDNTLAIPTNVNPPNSVMPSPSAMPAPGKVPATASATAPAAAAPIPRGPRSPRTGGRAVRREEEDIPGADYMERMTRLGPRAGETTLAFEGRLASVSAIRASLLASAQRNFGQPSDVCREKGISRHNLSVYLKNCGLTMADLRSFNPDAAYRSK